MILIKAIGPSEVADELVSVLGSQPGAGPVARYRGAETARGWDVVETELPDRAVVGAIDAIAAIGGSEDLELSVAIGGDNERYHFVDGRAVRAKGDSVDDLGISAAAMSLRRLVRVDYQYVLLMISAAVIATAGLIEDLPVAVVGAMAISPDLGRLNAIALALVARETRLLVRGAGSLAIGMLVAIATSAAGTLLLGFAGNDEPLAAVDDRLVTFVTELDAVTVTVALAAGVAAMVVFITDRGRAAVGVGVSITTIPAAAYAGIALADGEVASAFDAIGVLAVNILCVAVAGIVTAFLLRSHLRRRVVALERGAERGFRPR